MVVKRKKSRLMRLTVISLALIVPSISQKQSNHFESLEFGITPESYAVYIKKQTEKPFGEFHGDLFLKKISIIESSGGTNFNHRELLNGLHAGTSGIGHFGLMPVTVLDLARKLTNKYSDLGQLTAGIVDFPNVQHLLNLDPSQIKIKLESNFDLELKIARLIKIDLDRKHGNNEEKKAFAWNNGTQIKSSNITDDKLDDSNYIYKFRKLANLKIALN